MAVKKKTVKRKAVKKKPVRKTAKKRVTKKKTVKKKTVAKKKTVKKKTVKKVVKRKTIKKRSAGTMAKRKKARKSTSKRRSTSTKKNLITDVVIPMVVGGGSAIAGGMIAQKIPVANPKIKAAIPLIAGIGISMTKFGRKKEGKAIALGLGVLSVLSLAKQFAPQLPMLAGEEDLYMDQLDYANPSLLGYDEDSDYMEGEMEDFAGEPASFGSDIPWITTADIA